MQNCECAVSRLIARPVFGPMRAHRRFMIAINGPMLKMLLAGCALAIGAPLNVDAQVLPSEPFVFADGRVALGGDVSWSIAPEDPGFFNFTDYDHSSLRMIRAALTASVKAGRHVALLAEIRSENGQRPEAYGVYLRIRPWIARNIDIQVGRIPPTFGAFARRTYAADNPLIGYPLAYQYLTAIRADALPATVDELMLDRQPQSRTRRSAGQRVPVGHRRTGACRRRSVRRNRLNHDGHAFEPAPQRRQRRGAGGRPCRRASRLRSGSWRFGLARPVRHAKRAARGAAGCNRH